MLGGRGIFLETGETAEAVRDSIKSTILNIGQHLNGISKVAKDLYPDYKLKLKPRSSMTLAKLIICHIVTVVRALGRRATIGDNVTTDQLCQSHG